MLEYVIRGLLNGSVYALLALPMSLLFATAATVDFAIGAYALLAAAVAATVAGPLGMAAGMAAAMLASAVMALVFVWLQRSSDGEEQGLRIALASFGLSVAIASIVLMVWGTQPFMRTTFSTYFEIGGLRINPQGLINVSISVGLVIVLYYLLQRTNLGRMMRAAAANPAGAELGGIPVMGVQCSAILAGGLLGGIAGLLILRGAGMDFTASLGLTLIGFTAAIIFGIHSPMRSLFGGLAMGVIEALSSGYTSGMLTSMIPALFMLIALVAAQRGGVGLNGDRP
ncbi:MAG: branched-chain amino acid ABC transporter permease [Burkholderiaceae bacterium]|nr:branched-chain amino acid ABC transporter permease [Burkholderiaceae bacterium]